MSQEELSQLVQAWGWRNIYIYLAKRLMMAHMMMASDQALKGLLLLDVVRLNSATALDAVYSIHVQLGLAQS